MVSAALGATTLLSDRMRVISRRADSFAWPRLCSALFVIAQFADREGNLEAILPRRQRAGGVGRVGARWIFQAIEIEHQFAGLVQAVCWESGVEKAARPICGGRAGCVAK